jgi:hypothetical protein
MNIEELAVGVLSGEIELSEIDENHIEALFEALTEISTNLLGTEHDAVAKEMLAVLAECVNMYDADPEFESEIVAAEQRGSTYFELEVNSLH